MYKILVTIIRLLIGWKIDLKIVGQENLPEKGPALVIFNHSDFLDTLAIPFSLPRTMTAFVAYKYRNNPLVFIFKLAGSVILVKRGRNDTAAMDKGIKVLENNGFLVLSPEGTRSSANTLNEGKYGPAYLAGITGCLTVPVGIQGTVNGYKRLFGSLLSRKKININVKIGQPFYLNINESLKKRSLRTTGVKNDWQEITNSQMMPRIAELL